VNIGMCLLVIAQARSTLLWHRVLCCVLCGFALAERNSRRWALWRRTQWLPENQHCEQHRPTTKPRWTCVIILSRRSSAQFLDQLSLFYLLLCWFTVGSAVYVVIKRFAC